MPDKELSMTMEPPAAAAAGGSADVGQPGRRIVSAALRQVADAGFAAPAIVIALGALLIPAAVGIERAFTNWVPGTPSSWVGLENFRTLFSDDTFHAVLSNEAWYLLGVPLWTVIPLAVALLLYERVPLAGLFRTIMFFPAILSPVVIGLLFQSFLPPDGMLNHILSTIGLGFMQHDWVDDPGLVRWSIMGIVLWGGLGVNVLIFSASLSSLSPELLEAAEIDGASWWERLRYVVLPGIRAPFELVLALNAMTIFLWMFGWIFVLTQGGPGNASATMDFDVYQRSFAQQSWGPAAAEALILFAIVLLLVGVLLGLRRIIDRPARRVGPSALALRRERLMHSPALAWVGALRDARGAATGRLASLVPSRRRRFSPARIVLCVLLAVPFIYPFVFLVSLATRTTADYQANPLALIPHSFTLAHLKQAWTEAGLGRALVNSAIAVGFGTVLATVASTLATFWFIRHRGRVANVLLLALAAVFVFPGVAWLLPLYVLMSDGGLLDSLWWLGVVYAATQIPLGLGIIYSYCREGIPGELLEAAGIDGASLWQQFVRIVVPLARPGIAAMAALSALSLWGDLLIGLVTIQTPEKFTAIVAISSFSSRGFTDAQLTAAGNLIIILPVLAVFLVAQRAIVRGFTAGVGK
jgi:ABC-type sugar transport system permease subunit